MVTDDKIKKYLQIGTGSNYNLRFINLDYVWQETGVDVFWDITKGNLPFSNDRFEGIYTEHCLEHISFDECQIVLKEFKRILKKNGVIRIIVPDGGIYIDTYVQKKGNANVKFPYNPEDATSMISFNRIFYGHGHRFIYDFETMKFQLEKAGFKDVIKVDFKIGKNPDLLIDSEYRKIESMYVEAYL